MMSINFPLQTVVLAGIFLLNPTHPSKLLACSVASLKAAAAKGDPHAQLELARCYERGNGLPHDASKAAYYAESAARKGNVDAQMLFGSFLGRGFGVGKDEEQAVGWYRRAAEQGDPLAEFALGEFYSSGRGVAQDEQQALYWYNKAAALDQPEAQDALGHYYLAQATTNFSSYSDAFKWLKKAAEAGYLGSMNNLGFLYESGLGTNQDPKTAADWYRRAAERGIAKAQANLGLLFFDGRGKVRDIKEAYVWFKLGQGSPVGKKYVMDYHENDWLTPQEFELAEKQAQTLRLQIMQSCLENAK